MPEHPNDPGAEAGGPGRRMAMRLRDPWPARAALFFVLLTLMALVVVPVLVQRRVNELREDAEVSEPARTLVTRLQFNLVRELAALNERLLGGDSASVQTYAEAREEEQALFAELEPLAGRLGSGVLAQHARSQVLAEQWHARVTEDEFFRADGSVADTLIDMRELVLFEDVLRALGDLDDRIVEAAGARRDRIIDTEQLGLRITFVLGMLALLAAAAVAVLVARVRHFAAESERRRAEVEEALMESARLAEARTRLLRGITHDVKNPLGAAKGYAELLAMGIKGPIAPEQAPFIEGIQRSVDGALAIIADLLDVARADSGGLTLRRELVDLTGLAGEMVGDQRAVASAAGHDLQVLSTEPTYIHTDPARVRQVLGNLLSNAIKYTPAPGLVVVQVGVVDAGEAEGAPRGGRWATISVRDTGPGIPPEMREVIFDEFARLDDHAEMKGHGLGLTISRRIARLLGGDLIVADTPGPGATFVLWLPFRDDGTGASGTR